MPGIKGPASFGFVLITVFLSASVTPGQALQAQDVQALAGTTVVVRLIDAVDSAGDSAGRQYRASVTKPVDAGNGEVIAQGAAASVTLVRDASGWVAQLSSLVIDGQAVAVTSNAASVTSSVQSAAGSVASAVGSVLGGFGRVRNVPSGVTAVATGQRVALPPGTTLTFVLGQPPVSSPAASTAPATLATPAPSSLAAAPAPGQDAYLCRFYGQKDAHPIIYVTPILFESMLGHLPDRFYAYMQATYDANNIQYGRSGCERVSNNAAAQANTMDMLQKQWAASKTEVIHVSWTDTSAENAAVSAPAASATATPRPAALSQGGPFISCSTSGGAGIDTYLTGVFRTTRPVRHLPSGGNLVDQSVLDDFYAYLKQKGYNFKPGSNYGCDVAPTEAAARAAQHKRAYEGGSCSTCGKIVETAWKDE